MADELAKPQRSNSMSQASESSQTAQEFIASQLQLEAEAREVLPYVDFSSITIPCCVLTPPAIRYLHTTTRPSTAVALLVLDLQSPPASSNDPYTPAGVCYSCSISCHGEHTLVELFSKRDFTCDCGTTRLPSSAPCTLRMSETTGRKGDVTGETPRKENNYNHNFAGRFCGCGEVYDPAKEKGTMFQCLGLGTIEDGDVTQPEDATTGEKKVMKVDGQTHATNGNLGTIEEEPANSMEQTSEEHMESASQAGDVGEDPLPSGFPKEDDFDHFICYKCVNAFPWIKAYAGTEGFLPAVPFMPLSINDADSTRKRKVEDDDADESASKRARTAQVEASLSVDSNTATLAAAKEVTSPKDTDQPSEQSQEKHQSLPSPPSGDISLFLEEDFRNHLCRCSTYSYEPPISETDAGDANGGGSVGTGSLLERGEAALSGMDRVRAIEGVMAYNALKEKVKSFLQPFAESGQAVGAEDIKAYFAKLRGDDEAMKLAAAGAENAAGGGEEGNGRREQGGET
ncbi:hypothetical protein H2203_005394 [Taxawa tesnikishii (nom. ined.)]|nr:hypothetical protein H2203_005394 [Dothideales sp. JES 119]